MFEGSYNSSKYCECRRLAAFVSRDAQVINGKSTAETVL